MPIVELLGKGRPSDGQVRFVTNYACVGLKSDLTIPEELICVERNYLC